MLEARQVWLIAFEAALRDSGEPNRAPWEYRVREAVNLADQAEEIARKYDSRRLLPLPHELPEG